MTHRVKHKKCRVCEKRHPVYRFHKNQKSKDGLRNECWKCSALARAERREKEESGMAEPQGSIFFKSIPVERVLPIFKDYMRAHPGITNNTNGSMVRAVHRMENELSKVGFDFLDRWLVEFDLAHLWHVPAEDGGFADLYEFDLRAACSLDAQTPRHENGRPQQPARRGKSSGPTLSVSPSGGAGTPTRKAA